MTQITGHPSNPSDQRGTSSLMTNPVPTHYSKLFSQLAIAGICGLSAPGSFGQPFTVTGPGVNTNAFRVTTYTSGLDFPMGMAELQDGSLLVDSGQSRAREQR